MRPSQIRVVWCQVLALILTRAGQTKLDIGEAKHYVGEQATVCGKVASNHFA